MSQTRILRASGLSTYEIRIGRALIDEVAPA
ncbi:MAG: hypothetical protein RL523_1046, partial [Actinomycetota bacterium]